MKRVFISVLLSITLLLCSCASDADRSGIVIRGDMPSPANPASYYANEDIVYVTKSGEKYHKENCSFLKSSKIMVSLEQAILDGKEPCSKCFGNSGD